MAVTSMPSIDYLVSQLDQKYPHLKFTPGDDFAWTPKSNLIVYIPKGNYALLLHEVGHALLEHQDYQRDIELVGMERAAWSEARRLASDLAITISEPTIDNHLETYRDWLDERSLCPKCHLNGLQESTTIYRCLSCHSRWKVNEARTCGLKRTIITNQ